MSDPWDFPLAEDRDFSYSARDVSVIVRDALAAVRPEYDRVCAEVQERREHLADAIRRLTAALAERDAFETLLHQQETAFDEDATKAEAEYDRVCAERDAWKADAEAARAESVWLQTRCDGWHELLSALMGLVDSLVDEVHGFEDHEYALLEIAHGRLAEPQIYQGYQPQLFDEWRADSIAAWELVDRLSNLPVITEPDLYSDEDWRTDVALIRERRATHDRLLAGQTEEAT